MMGRKPFSVTGTLDDNLMAGIGQTVEDAVAQDGVIEEAEPFLHGPVGCDDEAGDAMTADYKLIEVSRLLGYEAMKAEVIEDDRSGERKVRSTELSTLAWAMALKKLSAWRNRAVYPAMMGE